MARNNSDATTAFEREKWQSDERLRERELALKERDYNLKHLELRLKSRSERRNLWTNPLILAVFAAALAAAGNAVVALINGIEQRQVENSRAEAQLSLERQKDFSLQAIEETKAEAARIFEVIKTNNVDGAKKNLEFLVKTGLISNQIRLAQLKSYLAELKPGEGPTLPSAAPSVRATPDNMESVPEQYRPYFARYNDGRSITEKLLNTVLPSSIEYGRSFALIAGVSNFSHLGPLVPAGEDVKKLTEYLINYEKFDEVVVLKDADVSLQNFYFFCSSIFLAGFVTILIRVFCSRTVVMG
jgi:hypothetical protein